VQVEAPKFATRFYQARDREAVRQICADTGFLGSPIDPIFEDREIFADYLTGYYTDIEPESTLVTEVNGRVVGYIMGCRLVSRHEYYRLAQNLQLAVRGLFRYFHRPYNPATRRYIKWLISQSGKESPHTPHAMPHFHINLLPEARSVAQTRALINQFLEYLAGCGEKAVYGQVVTFDKRRGPRMFERYGFRVVDQVEVTKYRWLRPAPVFLFTVIKDLTVNTQLYGHDLRKA
jgi:ribosomal protein S18 acetylase RimI-like enzyme